MNEKILSNMVFQKLKEYYKFANDPAHNIDMDIGTVKKKIKEINQKTSVGFRALRKF